MTLFDISTWDGNPDSLPAEVRGAFDASIAAKQETPDAKAAREREFNDRINANLNQRRVEDHISTVRARVSAEKFDDASEGFKRAVLKGGVSMDAATNIYFPQSETPDADLAPPPSDPAARPGTPPAPNSAPAEWNKETIMAQTNELRKMSMAKALAWRRDPANKAFVSAEMKGYQ